MRLTDIDGTQFELDINMIAYMYDRKTFREIRTIMKDVLQVRESIPEIMKRIMEEKK